MSINLYDKLRSAFGGAIVDAAETGLVATGFSGNLDGTVTNVQLLADTVDGLTVSASSNPEIGELIVDIPQRVDVNTDLNGQTTLRYRVYNHNTITSLQLFVNQNGIFSTFPVTLPTGNGLQTAIINLTGIITSSNRKIGFVLVANNEFLSSTNIIQVDTIEGSDVTIDSSSFAEVDADNVQELAGDLDALTTTVNTLVSGGRSSIGAITPFTSSVTVNAQNYEQYDQEVALYVRQDNARISFTLPTDAIINNRYPATITILHQGGTSRITTGGGVQGPDNTIRVDVVGANNIRRNSESGTLLNFAQVFQNDFATFTKASSSSPWVFRTSTLSQGALLLPDGIFNLNQGITISFNTALTFFTISDPLHTVAAGDAFRVIRGDDDFAGFGVKEDDVLVALIDSPSRAQTADNDDWLIIRNAHNNTISLTELFFLNQVSERDSFSDSRLTDRSDVTEVNVWLSPFILDHAPFLNPSTDPNNPQSGETEDYLGGREDRGSNNEFESTSNLPNRFVYIDIDGSFDVNDLGRVFLVHRGRDGTEIERFSLDTDFRGAILSGSTDTYYIFDDVAAADNFSSINYLNGQTLEVVYRTTNREFTLSDNVNIVSSIPDGGLPLSKLEPNTQALITADHSLTQEQLAKLDGLEVSTSSSAIPNNEPIYVKLNAASTTNELDHYIRIEQLNGIIPNYERTRNIFFLVDPAISLTGLQKVDTPATKLSVTSQGVITTTDTSGNQRNWNAYTATLPAITGANSVLDNAWQLDGTRDTSVLSGAEDTFKAHIGNLGQDVLDRIGGSTTPTTLPENLQTLSNDMTVSTTSDAGWRALASPIRANLTRQFALLWDENRRTFTGNYFDDITGIDILGFSSNTIFYYTDPNDPLNRSFPGAQSYIENDNVRVRNTSGDTPITPSFRKVIGFDYALQRELVSSDNVNMLRLGDSSVTPLMALSENEGLYLNIGRQDGGQRTRTYEAPLEVDGGQLSTRVDQSTIGEAEVIIPNSLTGALTVTVEVHGFDNDNDEGTHTETFAITNLDSDQNFGNRTFNFPVIPDLTLSVDYDHDNNDESFTRRVLTLAETVAQTNAAVHYQVEAHYSVTETWNVPTTYARFPIDAGNGHDDFGLFDPHRYNTEHVEERNRVLLVLDTYRQGDTSSDPEMAVRVVVDGEREGSASNEYTIRLHRPASDFDFNDISFGNSICAIAHIQVYDYDENLPPSEAELLTLYSAGDRWLGAFSNTDENFVRFDIAGGIRTNEEVVFQSSGLTTGLVGSVQLPEHYQFYNTVRLVQYISSLSELRVVRIPINLLTDSNITSSTNIRFQGNTDFRFASDTRTIVDSGGASNFYQVVLEY